MKSLWLSHPTGNTFVRALLHGLKSAEWDYHFFTTVGVTSKQSWIDLFPERARSELSRRSYDLPLSRMTLRPLREALRLTAERFTASSISKRAPFSIQAVYEDLDSSIAIELKKSSETPDSIYAYEDGALKSFEAAKTRGIQCVYDLPIAYWQVTQKILRDEAARSPEWEPTLGSTTDSDAKLERKTRELELSDLVVCPSHFVLSSLPKEVRSQKHCILAPFGSPPAPARTQRSDHKLRVLFAGQMTQRKGLADLFAAMKLLRRSDVELTVLGSPIQPIEFYRNIYRDFVHEPPRSHSRVLELMTSCDLLVLPSLIEGRALVQQEALACGLPLIVTENAGASDLIDPQTGFLVPIRSPERIAEKIDWFASHRDELENMRSRCCAKAAEYTWADYSAAVLSTISSNRDECPAFIK